MDDRGTLEFLALCSACDVGGFETASQYLTQDMFSLEETRTGWKVIQAIYKAGNDRVDYAQLLDGMQDAGVKVTSEWIDGISKSAWESSHAAYHAKRLVASYRADRLRAISEIVTRQRLATDDWMRWLQSEIESIAGGIEKECQSIADVLATPDSEARIVTTGFQLLNQRLGGGMRAKELIVAGGRPGAGKTTLMMQMALQSAVQQGTRTLIVTIEMAAKELIKRMLRTVDREKLERLPIFIRDDLTEWRQMEAAIKQAIRSKGIELVVVDYIQRIRHDGTDHRERQIAEISGGLKDIARTCDIPVIAGSQLNRESARNGSRPTLKDLRESGAIEQDADIVLLLGQTDEDSNARTFDIAKQRNGPTGKYELRLDGPAFWFHEVDESEKYQEAASQWS